MIRNRWVIPAIFGVLCLVLGVTSVALSSDGTLKEMEEGFRVGQSHSWSGLALEKDKRYTLKMRPKSGVQRGHQVVFGATLLSGEVPVFEIEDAYWHEAGTWREGGESGSWEEQNSASEFSFVVPEDGNYDLEITLASATSIAGDRIQAVMTWREPWVLTAWPLFLGAFVFLGVGGWVYVTRRKVMSKFLETMAEGTKLKIGDEEFAVIGRMEHWEDRQRNGVEFRLRSTLGVSRWLSISRYWREIESMESGGVTMIQTTMDVPLTAAQEAELERQTAQDEHITLGDELYWRDRENGGFAQMVTTRDGAVYVSRYRGEAFRDQHRLPREVGDRWLEHTLWHDSGESEWSLSEIADTDTFDVLEMHVAEHLTADRVFDQGHTKADPFGVAHLRGRKVGTAQEQQQTSQQNAQHSNDWNA